MTPPRNRVFGYISAKEEPRPTGGLTYFEIICRSSVVIITFHHGHRVGGDLNRGTDMRDHLALLFAAKRPAIVN